MDSSAGDHRKLHLEGIKVVVRREERYREAIVVAVRCF
jgi:hypothetical protein